MYSNKTKEQELLEFIFDTDENKDNLKQIEQLIRETDNIDYGYYSKFTECIETMLSTAIIRMSNSNTGKIVDYYAEVAEMLLSHGASFHFCDDDCGYTALDHLILQGGKHGLNQNTYRLAKIMITSLNEEQTRSYLRQFRNQETFNGLIKIFQEFNRYDKYLEYMF